MGALKNIANILKYGFYVGICTLLFAAGWVGGRKTVKIPKPETIVEYIEGESIHDTLYSLKPYAVKTPADTLDIIRKCIADGVYKELWPKEKEIIEITKDDTTAILKDWATAREYNEKLFDFDTLGKCSVNATVQYNRLKSIGYEYSPAIKEVTKTIYSVKKWSPFVEVGYSTNPWSEMPDNVGEIGTGIFYNEKYGASLRYQRGFNSKNDYIGVSGILKF